MTKKKILIGIILLLIAILALPQTRYLLYILSERPGAKKIEKMKKDWAGQTQQPKEGAEPTVWQIFSHETAGFTIKIPPGWKQNDESEYLQFGAPDDEASITLSAYSANGGEFGDFIDNRFQSVPEFYKLIKRVDPQEGAEIAVRQFQGIWPDDDHVTHYTVACIDLGDVYTSVGIVTTPKFYAEHENEFNDILQSITKNREQGSPSLSGAD